MHANRADDTYFDTNICPFLLLVSPYLQLTCVPGILEPYGDFQTVRIECGGKIEPGSVATGDYNWGTLLADKTHFRSAVMELDQLPDYVTEVRTVRP